MASVTKWANVAVLMQSALGAAKSITAISKAAPGVVTISPRAIAIPMTNLQFDNNRDTNLCEHYLYLSTTKHITQNMSALHVEIRSDQRRTIADER